MLLIHLFVLFLCCILEYTVWHTALPPVRIPVVSVVFIDLPSFFYITLLSLVSSERWDSLKPSPLQGKYCSKKSYLARNPLFLHRDSAKNQIVYRSGTGTCSFRPPSKTEYLSLLPAPKYDPLKCQHDFPSLFVAFCPSLVLWKVGHPLVIGFPPAAVSPM